ncbi:hypothetical protein [Protofrankia symbiont of Coriaria ruscifolia]|uniref:hypothetical protein n=1 Tax=Protofrankia symbiont of Coriaria ruscifolia TaxID=1306542 RepID=UPI00104109B8|nr:hypothetical protein [Protofrankia symbiont of Coriaria ruscifolia]
MDEKPEQSPGVSGDAVEDVDLWVPPADDPLFGPLSTLPSSIRRPVWTSDVGVFDTAAAPVQPLDTALRPTAASPAPDETGSSPQDDPAADDPPEAVTDSSLKVPIDDAVSPSRENDTGSNPAPDSATPKTPVPSATPVPLEISAPLETPVLPETPVPSTTSAPVIGNVRNQRNQTVPLVTQAGAPGADDAGLDASGSAGPKATSGTSTRTFGDATGSHRRAATARGGQRVPAGYVARLIAITGVVAIIVIASVAVLASRDRHNGKRRSAVAATTAPGTNPNFINSARTDSDPVTPTEFFNSPRVTLDLHSYTRLAYKLDSGCPGLTGELASALSGDRCRQLVRAVYLTEPDASGHRVLAAASVLVLDDVSTAQNAAKSVTAGRGGISPLPVPAESLPGATVTDPTRDNSWRAAPVTGRYLIVIQLAYTDGTQGAATDPALTTARRDLPLLASQPISQRVLTGHGPR